MMRKLDKYLLILSLVLFSGVIHYIFWDQNRNEVTEDQLVARLFKCPEYYSTQTERTQNLAQWINFFKDKYPEADLEKMMDLRYDFLVSNNCTETLQIIAKNVENSIEVERQEIIKSVVGEGKSKIVR